LGWPNFGSPLLRPLVQGATCTSMEAALLAGREPTSTMSISRHHWQGRVVARRIEARSAVQTRIWSGRGQYGTRDQARPPPSSAFWFHRQKHRREAPTATARDPIRREQAGGSGARARWNALDTEGGAPLRPCGRFLGSFRTVRPSPRGFRSRFSRTGISQYRPIPRAPARNRCTMFGCILDRHCRRRRERRRRELNAQPQRLWRKRY
jgi:hypothetical protein